MKITINEVENGIGLRVDGEIYIATEYNHVKPGKGAAFVRIRLKNIKTDAVLERTFRTSESLDRVDLEQRKFQFLYRAGNDFHFMDQETFEEQILNADLLGYTVNFLKENEDVIVIMLDHKVLKIEIPNFIIATVVESEPGIKGDSSRSGTKPSKIDTGATVQVPLFIEVGEVIKVDTRSGIYVERVKK